jgi:hypothetical protein
LQAVLQDLVGDDRFESVHHGALLVWAWP